MQEIQKIVVFEGAFERLFMIISEEGGPEGGIIVQVTVHYCDMHDLGRDLYPALDTNRSLKLAVG